MPDFSFGASEFWIQGSDYGLGRKLEGRVYRVDWTARVPVPSANSVGRAHGRAVILPYTVWESVSVLRRLGLVCFLEF